MTVCRDGVTTRKDFRKNFKLLSIEYYNVIYSKQIIKYIDYGLVKNFSVYQPIKNLVQLK